MTRAIVWKEFREQGLIGLTLMVLGAGILVAAAMFADPPTPGAGPADIIRYLGAGQLATLLLAVTAGTVCGGALFAAEREAGTMGFLESLPVSRWQLWRGKMAAGSALAVTQIVMVLGVAAGLGLIESGRWAAAIFADALLAFAWGVFGSTVARTTLGSVGVAVPAASVAAFVFLVPVMLLFQHPRTNMPRTEGSLIFLALMVLTPIAGSALRFTRPDRERAAHDPTPVRLVPVPGGGPGPTPRGRPAVGLRALGWLAARQLARPGLVISGFAVGFGMVLLSPAVQPVLAWPVLALVAGVLAGVTAFADEQAHGSARFWGERRLPTGRLWGVKVAAHALFALWLAALLALPSAVRAESVGWRDVHGANGFAVVFRTLLFDHPHLGSQTWKYLLVPLAYGFAAGLVCSMLLRKTVVAAGVAGMVGGTAAALWLPSLLAGGVAHWQVWLPPAVILATSRLLARPWAADRLTARAPLAALGGGAVVVLLAMTAGIGYRVAEVPDDPAGEDDVRYVAGLAPLDANDSGREFRTATERFARVADAAPPPHTDLLGTRRAATEERVVYVPVNGWQGDDDLAHWLDEVYRPDRAGPEERWYEMAAGAARLPTGIFEHPQRSGTTAGAVTLANGRRMGAVIVAHGLRRQADGDPAAFPADLRTALALGRSLRNGSIILALIYGTEVTRTALFGAERWLTGLDARPAQLREVLAVVLEDDRTALTRLTADGRVLPPSVLDHEPRPMDLTPHFLAQRYVTRELLKAPGAWLPNLITPPGGNKEAAAPVADLVGLAWSVPWERERTRRLLGLGFESGSGSRPMVRGRPGTQLLTAGSKSPAELEEADRQLRTQRRAVAVMLAVRLFQAENDGATPPDPNSLVRAGYLPAVPTDPYDGRSLRYRVSKGEELTLPSSRMDPMPGMVPMAIPPPATPGPPPVKVLPGQVVIWSVGPNRKDGKGVDRPLGAGLLTRQDDIVFLVPPLHGEH